MLNMLSALIFSMALVFGFTSWPSITYAQDATEEGMSDEAPADEGMSDEAPADEGMSDEAPADEGMSDEAPADGGASE
jgi:hypothetical protein